MVQNMNSKSLECSVIYCIKGCKQEFHQNICFWPFWPLGPFSIVNCNCGPCRTCASRNAPISQNQNPKFERSEKKQRKKKPKFK